MIEPIIFTLSLNSNENELLKKINLPTINIQITDETQIPDKDRILSEIVEVSTKQNKQAIFNIQLNNNLSKSIFDLQDIINYQNLNIKTTITFDHYNSLAQYTNLNPDLVTYWQQALSKVDHIFFTKEQDQNLAISEGFVLKDKASNINDLDPDLARNIFNKISGIKEPVNKIISNFIPGDSELDKTIQATKKQGGRVVIQAWPLSADEAASLIAAKFGIENPDQIYGLKLETTEILKDKNNAAANLEKYITQLSEQFQKDSGKTEINPVDINFDIKNNQKILNTEKNIENNRLENMMLDKQKYESKNATGTQSFFNKIFNYVNSIFNSFREAIFGKKESETTIMSTPANIITTQEKKAKPVEQIQPISPTVSSVSEQSSSPVATAIKDLVREDYLYTDDNIRLVLENSLDRNKAEIQQLSLAWSDELKKDIISDIIKTLKTGQKEYALIPIETGGEHWVGMTASYNKGTDNVTFTYSDPMGNPMTNREGLQKLITEISPNAIIIDQSIKQQENAYDCGVFVCDNLTKFARGQAILSTEQSKGNVSTKLREAHARTLQQAMDKEQARKIGEGLSTLSPSSQPASSQASTASKFIKRQAPNNQGLKR